MSNDVLKVRAEIMSLADSYADLFRQMVVRRANEPAYMMPNYQRDGEWITYTWQETQTLVDEMAAGLMARGLQKGQRVGLISTTRLEWVWADYAVTCAGGAITTVYPNTGPEDVEYILVDSDSVMLFVENAAQLDKAKQSQTLRDRVTTVVMIDDTGVELSERVINIEQLRELGRQKLGEEPHIVDEMVASLTQEDLSTLIYTSGTTGKPKGVRLLHRSWVMLAGSVERWDIIEPGDVMYLWLPLSHVFGRALLATQLRYGYSIAVDGRIDRIMQGLAEVRPHVMCGAPRIFEKVRNAVFTTNTGVKGKIAHWAFGTGMKTIPYRLDRKPLPPLLKAQFKLADKLVFGKLKEKLGGRMKFMISGSAKLSPQVQRWFYAADILVVEGYGSTETSALILVNVPNEPEFGTVGRPIPGTECKIADDGEIMFRSPAIMESYHKLPEQTAEALTEDQWFRTGDIGEWTEQGNIIITDRKKDLFKTSGGKYVAPQKVEGAITANIPYVSQAVAVGDGRKFVTALVVMDPELLQTWADKRDKGHLSYAELTQLPEIHASVEKQMEKVNERLERWETVKKFAILPEELTLENDAATASLKIRRRVVVDRYADVIDSLYPKD